MKESDGCQLEDVQDAQPGADFLHQFLPLIAGHTRDEIVVCPPYIDIYAAVEGRQGVKRSHRRARSVLGKRRRIHRRNLSAACCWTVGCTHVIIGHSERRQYFGETDDMVNFKLKAALEAGLDADRLCGRSARRARSQPYGRCSAPAVPASVSCDFGKEGAQAGGCL